MGNSTQSKVNPAPSQASAIVSKRDSVSAIYDQGHKLFDEACSEAENVDLGNQAISLSTQSKSASNFGHQLTQTRPQIQYQSAPSRNAIQLKPWWDNWKFEFGVGPVETPKIEGPASSYFRSHPDLGIPNVLLGKGLGIRFSNQGLEPIAIDGLGGKEAWQSYSMSDARKKINEIGDKKKDSEIDQKILDSLTQEISRSARPQAPPLTSLPLSLEDGRSDYQLNQGDLRPNMFSPPSLFSPDELQLTPPFLLSDNEEPEKRKRIQRKQVRDEPTQPKLLQSSSNSSTTIQLKAHHSAPIQRQGYGYEDEEQMMSVLHEDSAGMTSPDAPMSTPKPSSSGYSSRQSSYDPWAGMTSPDAPMSIAISTDPSSTSASSLSASSLDSRDLLSSLTDSSASSTLWDLASNSTLSQSVDIASGAASLFENANPTRGNMPKFQSHLIRVGGTRGWDIARGMENAISYPEMRAPGVFAPSGSVVGSRLPVTMSRASAVLAPLGMITSSTQMYDAWQQEGNSPDKYVDMVTTAPGLFSSTVGTTALAGAGLSAAGSSSFLAGTLTGAALSSAGGGIGAAAGTLGPAAAVAGSFAGGYALSDMIFNDWLGADEAIGGFCYDLLYPEDDIPRTNRRGL